VTVHEPRQPDRQPGERDGALLHRVPDVVRRTSLSRATVNRLLASGEIPSITIGRARLGAAVDLEGYVNRLGAEQLGTGAEGPRR
jgi:hypothetical protein